MDMYRGPISPIGRGRFLKISVWFLGEIGLPRPFRAVFESKRFFFRYTDMFSFLCTALMARAVRLKYKVYE